MDEKAETVYNNYEEKLRTDLLRLDNELIEMPVMLKDAIEMTAMVQAIQASFKFEREVLAARLGKQIEQQYEKKPAEAVIEREILLNTEYQKLTSVLQDADLDVALWKALVDGLRTKAKTLETTCEMILAGYISKDHVIKERRNRN